MNNCILCLLWELLLWDLEMDTAQLTQCLGATELARSGAVDREIVRCTEVGLLVY